MPKKVFTEKQHKTQTSIATPPAGFMALAAKSDGFYQKNSSGVETALFGGGGGGNTTVTGTLGENVASTGKVICQKLDGKFYLADNTDVTLMEKIIGMNTQTGNTNDAIEVERFIFTGTGYDNTASAYWIGTAGNITTTKPANGTAIQKKIGHAISSTVFAIQPDPFLYTPRIIDRISLPVDHRRFTSGSYTRYFDFEGGPYGGRWPYQIMTNGRVLLELAITGGASSPYRYDIRFITSGGTVFFEYVDHVLGNQSANEMSWFTLNPLSSNSVSWNPSSVGARGINRNSSGGEDAWEVQIAYESGGGGYYFHMIDLVLIDF
jgi:hypothetical protein